MIIIEINGGLGNQMFQYAIYCLLKRKKRVKVRIVNGTSGTRPYKLDIFSGVYLDECDKHEFKKIAYWGMPRNMYRVLKKIHMVPDNYYYEDENNVFDDSLVELDNKVLSGYFQSFCYVDLVEEELKKAFVFRQVNDELKSFCDNIPYNSVSVHIRRGDYLNYSEKYGNICTTNYYKQALDVCVDKGIKNFVVLSDDIEWVKENMSLPNPIYVEHDMFTNYEDWYDMYIMSRCAHNILANSTFSWWGTWLNDNPNKMVISPYRFENSHINKNLISDKWIVITP